MDIELETDSKEGCSMFHVKHAGQFLVALVAWFVPTNLHDREPAVEKSRMSEASNPHSYPQAKDSGVVPPLQRHYGCVETIHFDSDMMRGTLAPTEAHAPSGPSR